MDRKSQLLERLRRINDEIRAYPQPIARCDAQLGGLVEERQQIHQELDALDCVGSDQEAPRPTS